MAVIVRLCFPGAEPSCADFKRYRSRGAAITVSWYQVILIFFSFYGVLHNRVYDNQSHTQDWEARAPPTASGCFNNLCPEWAQDCVLSEWFACESWNQFQWPQLIIPLWRLHLCKRCWWEYCLLKGWGITASRRDLQSLTPLSVLGCCRLQLEVVLCAVSAILKWLISNWPHKQS